MIDLMNLARAIWRLVATRWNGHRRRVCAICGTSHHRPLRRRFPKREPGAREDNGYLTVDGDWIGGGRDFDGEYD